MANLQVFRDEDGMLITFSRPDGYPCYYPDAVENVLCPACANKPHRCLAQKLSLALFIGKVRRSSVIIATLQSRVPLAILMKKARRVLEERNTASTR